MKQEIINRNEKQMNAYFELNEKFEVKVKKPYSNMICMCMGSENCDGCPLRGVCGKAGMEELARDLIEAGEFEIG